MRPGRNDPCHCGSGRKYRKCCGAESAAGREEALEHNYALFRRGYNPEKSASLFATYRSLLETVK